MALINIDPEEVGLTGLLWLLVTYGYVLYFSSGLIGDGSELLLLVPSLKGLVGGVVLPLLGAVPDGAIILFSGLGDLEEAQETLSVGVGALAGSTIMLLTIPFFLSMYAGRVDINEEGKGTYQKKPKLTPGKPFGDELSGSGVALSPAVRESGKVMIITLIPYFLIQGAAMFIHAPDEDIAKSEHWYALAALLCCFVGLLYYMQLQLNISKMGLDREKRVAVMKKKLMEGKVSLMGAIKPLQEGPGSLQKSLSSYGSLDPGAPVIVPPEMDKCLRDVLQEAYKKYDTDGDGTLDSKEAFTLFRDFNENIASEDFDKIFKRFDADGNNTIDYDEFIKMTFQLIVNAAQYEKTGKTKGTAISNTARNVIEGGEDEEEEEVPEDFTDLSPDEQQAAIKKRAFLMLLVGTALVVIFSDPMVDVLQELANRAGIPPFYVAFVLAPLASNATEVLASQYYAAKKTRKTITVALSTLEGAAALNNTFCLGIFMGLVYFRGLAWQYTAETIAIILAELVVGAVVLKGPIMTVANGLIIFSVFPLSLVFVAVMESYGFD